MKNTFISILIFILLLCTVSFSIKYLEKSCCEFETFDVRLEQYVEGEKWDEAYDLSLKFLGKWTANTHKIAFFINHSEIDNINNELWKLTQYTKCKNRDESLASIHAIKFFIIHILNMEKINMQNIL